MDIESIITKIKKLFALAKDNANDNERDQAMVQAQKLLAQHNLDMVQVQAASLDAKPEEVVGDIKLEPYIRSVIAAVCALYYTTYFIRRIGRKHTYPVFVGTKDNIAVTQEMVKWMVTNIKREARDMYDDEPLRRSFRLGAAHRLMNRVLFLINQEKEGTVSGQNQLMVIRNSLEKANEDHIAAKGLKSSPARALSVEGNAYTYGQQYANSIPLSRDRGKSGSGVKRIGG